MINVTRHGTAAPISTGGSTAVGRARPGRLGATTVALLFLLVIALVQAMPAQAADPQSVSFNLDGCDLTQSGADPASYDPDSGDFVCDDPSYVGGNLGKGWEELDLVPFRFTATARNNAPLTQTYTISVVVDREDAGRPGYDDLSTPVLNTAKSDAGCNAPVVGAKTILSPGLGGIDKSLYRFVTITQPRGTECVYDYYARLAVGSHLFPGSSLHANLANESLNTSGIGAEDRSIPVKEIAPQAINKDMAATRNADHIWSVTKSPTPAELDFTNTCDSTALSAQVQIKVEWERLAATPSGEVTILTHVYATNPADRIITINVTDNVYEGTTQTTLVDSSNSGDVDVPKNTANFPVMTHLFTVPNSASHFNDVATATYKDLVTGVPVPGQTTTSAGADVQAGTTTNTSATITDVESISGAGFSYSVDSFSGASGSFSGGYLAGTKTTGDVTWVSGSQTGNGSVTFNKTVYVDGPQIGSGSLSDVATLNASDGFSTNANAAVALTTDAKVALTVSKTIPNVLGQGETDAFTFLVTGPNGYSEPVVLHFVAGDTSEFATLTGLAPGSYTVTETGSASGNWNLQPPQNVNLNLPTCSDVATFNNDFNPAIARVSKVTVPAGTSAGWQFQLVRTDVNPDVVVGTQTIAAGSGFHQLDGNLAEGTYEIRETDGPAGYDLTKTTGGTGVSVVGNVCTFTVDYVANAGDVFDCTFENTKEGRIVIEKQTLPAGSPVSFNFTGEINTSLVDNGSAGKDVDPGQYTVSESVPAGWDLTSIDCNDNNSSGSGSTATFNVEPGETVRCVFNNRQEGRIVIEKQTLPAGSPVSFNFTGEINTSLVDNGSAGKDVDPGQYTVSESVPAGWDLTSIDCNDGGSATPSTGTGSTATFNVDPGETVRCVFNNAQRGKIIVEKQTNPDGAAGDFTFTGDAAGTISDNGQIVVDNLKPGTYSSAEGDPTPSFDLTNIECNDGGSATASSGNVGTRTATFKLDPGETVKCTFTNRQRGMVELLKLTNGAPHPELDIRFTLYQDGPDTNPDLTGTDVVLENLSTLSDADGLLKFQTKLVPGTTYTICENPVPAGWTSLWTIGFTVGGQIVTPYNPGANDPVPEDVGIRCFDFTVQPGQTVQFEVRNDFPGGEPRTIGYWKNWNRCTGGGQAANADKNGGAAAGFYLVEDLLPQLIGDLNVTTCQNAVKILDKSTLAGRKSANDGAYELASQLLAAKFNLAAGAETCSAVQTAVVNGQNLLDAINFNGTGSYLTKSSAQRTLAISLASTLDKYNNGKLCP
jgi:Prealbumin-like fold domain